MSSLSEANEKLLEIYKAELAPPKSWKLKDAIAYRKQLSGAKGKGKIARFAPIGGIGMSNTSIPQSFPFIRFTNESPYPDDEELLRRGELIRNAMNKYDPYSTDHFEPLVLIRAEHASPDSIRYNANLVDAPSVPDPVIEYIKTLPKSPGPKMEILSSAKKFQESDYDADKLFFWTDGAINDAKATPANGNMLNIHLAIKRHGGDFLLKLKEEHMNRMIDIQIEIDRQLREFMIFGTTGNYVNRYTFMEALSTFPNEADNMMYNYVIDDATYKIFAKTLEIDSKGYRKWKRYVADKMARYLRFMTVHYKGKAETSGKAIVEMKAYEKLNKQAKMNRDRIDAITRVRIARVAQAAPATPTVQSPRRIKAVPININDMRTKVMQNVAQDLIKFADPKCSSNDNLPNYEKRMVAWGFEAKVINDRVLLAETIASFTVAELQQLYNKTGFCAADQKRIISVLVPRGKIPTTVKTSDERATFTHDVAVKIAAPFQSILPQDTKDQNDAVDRYIRDVKATTSKAELKKVTGRGQPDTSLLQNARDNDMGQAVRDKEAEFNAQSAAAQPAAQPAAQTPDYANMTLDEVSQLSKQEIRDNVVMKRLRELLGYINPRGSKLSAKKFTDEEFFELEELIRKVKAKETFDSAKAAAAKQRYEDKKEYTVGKCVKFDGNEVGTIRSVNLDNRQVGIEKYSDKSKITKSMDDIKTLTIKDCDNLKGGINLALSIQVKAQEKQEKERKAAEEAQQKRLEEEENKRKADEAAKAQQEINNAKELAATTESGDNWYVLKDGNDTMFYISSQDGNENLMSIIGSLPTDDHILKHETLTLKKVGDFHLFKMDNLTYKVQLDDDLTDIILTRNVGKALLIDETVQTGPLISEIRKQALDGLKALHKVGIVHQDIKLDNMAWDDKTNRLTIIDFGNARKVGNACESTFNGDDYNILPPVGVSENQYFSDKWSLVLALLQYGKKTMYASGDDPNDTIKSELTKLLFSADTEMKQDQNGCFKLLPEPEQSGLMFHNDDDETFKYRKELMKDVKVTTFHHLWFIFNRQADFNPPNLDEKGLVPGYRDKSELIDGVDYVKELAIRMGKTNVDLANKWIEGHLRWENLQAQVLGQPFKLITGAKIKDSKTQKTQFRTETLRDDLGIKYYGIPTKEVVEIFKIIGNYEAANKIKPTSSTSLNYDSFSDAELDELEVTYEPYDEEELDRLMSEYDSSSGTDANMSYNSYNSESEQSVESDSYDSDSD